MDSRRPIRQFAIKIVSDDYLDLHILAGAALAFTVLGIVGVASIGALASAILALLAVLAYSQIRARRQVAAVAAAQGADRRSIFQAMFPDDLEARRSSAASLLLIGLTLTRTVHGGSLTVLRQMLRSGGKMRVLLPNPADDALMSVASRLRMHGIAASQLKQRIEATINELAVLQQATNGDIEIRLAPFMPSMGMHLIDPGTPNGLIVLQHYQHTPVGESAPIFSLRPRDDLWYAHFVAEAERMWHDGTPWPTTPPASLRPAA